METDSEAVQPGGGAPATVLDALGALRMAVAQMRLYPKNSPQVAKVSESVQATLESFLGGREALTLAAAAEGLLVDGKRLPPGDAVSQGIEASVLSMLSESRVRSVRISGGLQPGELVEFLHALANKFWDLKTGAEINGRLRESGVVRISVDEVEYVAVGRGDMVLRDAADRLAAAGLKPEEFLANLDGRIEEAIEQGGGGSGLRIQLLRKLLDQDPSLLQQLQRQQSDAGLLEDAVGLLPFDQARGAMEAMAQAMEGMDPEKRELLRQACGALAGAFRPYAHLAESMKAAMGEAAADVVPGWMKEAAAREPDEPPAVRRVRKILSMSPTLQAEALCREGRGLIIELMKLGQQFFADEVLARLTDSLVEPSVQRRRLAIETLLSIAPVVEEGSPREGLEIGVRQALDRESDPRVYSQLTHLAASMADSRLHKGEVNQALRLLDVLKKHSVIKDAAFPERQHLVMPALEKVTAGEGYKAVAEKVKAVDTASERLQRAIDATALRFLISEMKNIESFAERVRVGETISKVGDAAAAVLSEEVQNASMPLEALRLLEVMPRLVSEAMAENALGGFVIAHPVLSVRRRAAQMMVEKGSPRAEEVLLLMFGAGSDPAVRAAFADALGRLKTPAAIRALSETAGSREEDENLRGAACAGLGRTGDPQVVPLLLSLAEKASKGLTRFFRSVSPAVRIAAYRALAAFPGDDRAREALQRGAEDSDAAVKAAVGQILKGVATRSASEVIRMVQGGDSGTTSGMLDEQGITPVCRAIAQEGRTGVLRVNSEGVQGSIHFRAGKATVAECGELKGKPAMDRLIAMKKGIYLFKAETPAPGGPPPA